MDLFAMHSAQRAEDREKKKEKTVEAVQLLSQANRVSAQASAADGEKKEKLLANSLVLKKKAPSRRRTTSRQALRRWSIKSSPV